jgi:hypothetical protein
MSRMAPFRVHGSLPRIRTCDGQGPTNAPAAALAEWPYPGVEHGGNGAAYWLVTADGLVFPFGGAGNLGPR